MIRLYNESNHDMIFFFAEPLTTGENTICVESMVLAAIIGKTIHKLLSRIWI